MFSEYRARILLSELACSDCDIIASIAPNVCAWKPTRLKEFASFLSSTFVILLISMSRLSLVALRRVCESRKDLMSAKPFGSKNAALLQIVTSFKRSDSLGKEFGAEKPGERFLILLTKNKTRVEVT